MANDFAAFQPRRFQEAEEAEEAEEPEYEEEEEEGSGYRK